MRLFNSTLQNNNNDSRPHININLNNVTVNALVDTGSSMNIIGGRYLSLFKNHFNIKKLNNMQLTSADGTIQDILGELDIETNYEGLTRTLKFIISPSISEGVILGLEFLRTFKIKLNFGLDEQDDRFIRCASLKQEITPEKRILEQEDLTENQYKILSLLKEDFKNISIEQKGLGLTPLATHKIITKGDPVRQRPYRLSPYKQELLNTEIDRMLKLGVIKPVRSEWSSPLVTVEKKDGTMRVCLDSRRLNAVTEKDHYPVAFSQRILDNLGNAHYLSSIDLGKAFWQIPLHEESMPKTAFVVERKGMYCFTRMPFGVCNATSELSRLMDKVFGLEFEGEIYCYADDLVIVSREFERHIELLKTVKDRLAQAGLTVNLKKSEFCKPEIKYLGYVVNKHGLSTDPEKIQCIKDFPVPKTVKEVRSFIGLASYYRRFIKNFAFIADPIHKLMGGKKGEVHKIVWNPEAQLAFEQLKKALTEAPVMRCPDYSKTFYLHCDASGKAIGAMIAQMSDDDGKEHPIAYFSKSLSCAERNYSATERELLAVLRSIQHYKHHLDGAHFKVYSDHSSLKWLNSLGNPTGRLARWSCLLSQYDFEIIHRKGALNVVPDVLSRIETENVCNIELKNTINGEDWYNGLKRQIIDSNMHKEGYKIIDDRVYKLITSKGRNLGTRKPWKLILKPDERQEAIEKTHDGYLGVHFGVYKTVKKLQEDYFWPYLGEDVKKFIETCDKCKAYKISTTKPQGLMTVPKAVDEPLNALSFDIIGPMPRSLTGHVYIFSIVDVFSKFVWLFPIKAVTSKVLENLLENEVFLKYGVPATIILDNAQYFRSHSFNKFFEKFAVPRVFTCYYSPSYNTVERYNQVVKTSLGILVGDQQRTWSKYLNKIQFAMNNHINLSTGYTPNFLMFAREPYIHGKLHGINSYVPKDVKSVEIANTDSRTDHIKDLEKIYRVVEERLLFSFRKNAERYNLRRKYVTFNVGDLVWRRNHVQSNKLEYFTHKLAPRYVQARVLRKISNNAYDLETLEGKPIGRHHIKDLVKISKN